MWLAARFSEPSVMRLLVKHGADPLFVHHADYKVGESNPVRRREAMTVLMAAAGMGGGTPWVRPDRCEREALALEAVKLAIELGIDVNAANTDGRTALDAAEALGYDAVVDLVREGREGRDGPEDAGLVERQKLIHRGAQS